MSRYQAPFEIHVHGDVWLRPDAPVQQVHEALAPLWKYSGAEAFAQGCASSYEEEPGLVYDSGLQKLQICWTVSGDDDFRQAIEDTCMGLNDVALKGAAIEVSFYDTEFDDDEDGARGPDGASRDDFLMCFVGPTPQAIMEVQRDMLVQDVVHIMERHFDASELGTVVSAVDALFQQRYSALETSMQMGRPPRGTGGGSGHGTGGRKPRHLH